MHLADRVLWNISGDIQVAGEYLEETHPQPALLPKQPIDRASVRMLLEVINSGTQPLQNSGVQEKLSPDPAERKRWSAHWITEGLGVYEKLLSRSGLFSLGDTLTMADIFLIPQIYNAKRYDVDFSQTPKIAAISKRCLELPRCQSSHPDLYAPSS